MKTIAIVAKTAGLLAALTSHLSATQGPCNFVHVTKISDAPAGATLAGLGLPQYVPGNQPLRFISVNTKITTNQEERDAPWELIRTEESPCEDILAQLSAAQDYLILPGQAVANIRLTVMEARMNVAEASTPEEKLAAYESAFAALVKALPSA